MRSCRAWWALSTLALSSPVAAQSSGARPYRPGIDVVHYELTLDLPDSGNVIHGRAELAVRRTAPVDTLTLDLIALAVDSVLVNDRPVRIRRDTGSIRIPLPPGSRDSLSIAVRYGGGVTDGLIVRTDSLGRWTGFGDNWPSRARYWIPSVDHPSDKATVTWTVRAPSERRVVANGELLEETPLSEARRQTTRAGATSPRPRTLTRWGESRPIPTYLMVIAAAPLAYFDLGRTACGLSELPGCVRQSVYVTPELRDYLPGPFARAAGIVGLFSRLVGPFPYEKLAHVQSSTRFGGMENASAIFYSDEAFRERNLRPGLIAHETAHQWFGDAVTEREWGHLWLSEGFASYFEQLWVEHTAGDTALRRGMRELREEIIKSPVTAQRPVIDTAETDYIKLLNTNSYQKGAWTLHMLRGLVGDSVFFRSLRSYYAHYHHSNAVTDDLQREFERVAGRRLAWFFDQWLRRPGYAELTTRWRYSPRARRVILRIEQGQRFAPYRFPLAVEVLDAQGRLCRATTEVAALPSAQDIALPCLLERPPQAVIFDPDVELLASFTTR